ncbi:hypothetical protein AJ79_07757 [Helicocarpus griseus UAMH5409]|uniref:Rhodopsin domain-containing protein n=1 Tax=Helicocarpus griseus UAMH5409 TaxID=1447875 RepID=A0A2B7WZH8_9EURO|nr:hypothetical protein AJ79_07757 [Helicocarpus griseus UAMH5409]
MAPISEPHMLARRGRIFYEESRNLVLIDLVMPSVAFLLVINRIYFRLKLAKRLGLDDYAIIAAMVFCIAMNTLTLCALHYGYGKRLETLSDYDRVMSLKMFWGVQIAYKFTLNTCKMSILLLYRRIFVTKKFRIVVNIVFTFVFLYFIASVIANILECRPVARIWDKTVEGQCFNLTGHWIANAVSTSSTDIATLILPMPVIHRLCLPRKQKYGLMCIFALGLFVCVVSLIRLPTLYPASRAKDQSAGTIMACLWTMLEANLSIICACLPMLRTPLSMLFPNFFPAFGYNQTSFSHQSSMTAAEMSPRLRHKEHENSLMTEGSSKSTTIQVTISRNDEAELCGSANEENGMNRVGSRQKQRAYTTTSIGHGPSTPVAAYIPESLESSSPMTSRRLRGALTRVDNYGGCARSQ